MTAAELIGRWPAVTARGRRPGEAEAVLSALGMTAGRWAIFWREYPSPAGAPAAKPEVVFACYGMNDGIYQPLDEGRFAAFREGVTKLIAQCKGAGVKRVVLVTPPIYDFAPKTGQVDYDAVLAAYARWETGLKVPGVTVIDLHTPMRKARDARTEPFSKDKVHPGDDGHLLMARTILTGLGVKAPDETLATIKADPLYKLVEEKRRLRSAAWMRHVGYTRETAVKPQPLGSAEADAAKLQERIDALRRPR